MKFGDPLTSKAFKLNAPRFFTTGGCGGATAVFRTLAQIQGQSEVGSETKGIRVVYHKKGMWYKSSSFVATRTNWIPSDILTHAEGGIASNGSESFSSKDQNPTALVCE